MGNIGSADDGRKWNENGKFLPAITGRKGFPSEIGRLLANRPRSREVDRFHTATTFWQITAAMESPNSGRLVDCAEIGNRSPRLWIRGIRQRHRPVFHDSPNIMGNRPIPTTAPFRVIIEGGAIRRIWGVFASGLGRGVARKWQSLSAIMVRWGPPAESGDCPRFRQDLGISAYSDGCPLSGDNRG